MHIPATHKETVTGVYERIDPSAPTDSVIQESYRNRAEKILRADKNHYERHAPLIRKKITEAGIRFDCCVAWAGGHPKLEAKAGFESVDVIDAIADMYQQSDDLFQEIYGPCLVDYVKSEITPKLVASRVFMQHDGYANTFVHFLEHLTRLEAIELLKACDGTPIIIYGPNIESAQNDGWFHFRPADHNTFWTGDAFARLLGTLGYGNVSICNIDEDYLIIATQ